MTPNPHAFASPPMADPAAAHAAHPFAMLIDPAAVIAAAQRSGSLKQVPRRILRPLERVSTTLRADGSPRPVYGDA